MNAAERFLAQALPSQLCRAGGSNLPSAPRGWSCSTRTWPFAQVAAQTFDNHLVFYQPRPTTSLSSAAACPPATGNCQIRRPERTTPDTAPSFTCAPNSPAPTPARAAQQSEADGWLILASPPGRPSACAASSGQGRQLRCGRRWRVASAALRPLACSSSCGSRPGATPLAWMSSPRAKGWKSFDAADVLVFDHPHAPDPPRRLPITPLDAAGLRCHCRRCAAPRLRPIAAHAEAHR